MVEDTCPAQGRSGSTLACLLAFVLLAASGLAHGWLTDRWGTSGALSRAIARLDRVPRSIGDWVSQDVAMERRQIERAQIRGYLSRKYRNARDGREVTVLLVCGRPGPISVHTPDVCYEGAGYEAESPPVPGAVANGDHHAEILKSRFRKVDALVPETLDIFWAWNARGVWEAPANPRIRFAPYQALFKVYVVASRGGTAGVAPGEAIVDADFAELFLTELDRALFARGDAVADESKPPGRIPPGSLDADAAWFRSWETFA